MAQGNARGMNQPITVTGDVTGTLENTTVTKLQNVTVASTTPTDAQVLTYVTGSTNWQPKTTTTVVGVTITNNQTNYTIVSTDAAIVLTGSTRIPTGSVLFPASATVGRIIFVANANLTASSYFTITPHAGTTIDGSSSVSSPITNGCIFCCYDGTNWRSVVTRF